MEYFEIITKKDNYNIIQLIFYNKVFLWQNSKLNRYISFYQD